MLNKRSAISLAPTYIIIGISLTHKKKESLKIHAYKLQTTYWLFLSTTIVPKTTILVISRNN